MDKELKAKILALCDHTDEVVSNGDWPTDEPMEALIADIREGLEYL